MGLCGGIDKYMAPYHGIRCGIKVFPFPTSIHPVLGCITGLYFKGFFLIVLSLKVSL